MKRVLGIAVVAGLSVGLVLVWKPWSVMAQSGQTMMGGQTMMMGPGLFMPTMNPAKGRKLFASKGCVVCHSVNGIGGKDAPALDYSTMRGVISPFDFVARMWQGAASMVAMQMGEMKMQTTFTGQELADIIAFTHDAEEQRKFSESDIPPEIKATWNNDALAQT